MTKELAINTIRDMLISDEEDNWYKAEDVFNLVDKIYDGFESRTCENCKFYTRYNYNDMRCSLRVIECQAYENNDKDFGCNKFKRKD